MITTQEHVLDQAAIHHTALVGDDDALDALHLAAAEAANGGDTGVIICGGAGTGKSVLAQAYAEMLHDAGVTRDARPQFVDPYTVFPARELEPGRLTVLDTPGGHLPTDVDLIPGPAALLVCPADEESPDIRPHLQRGWPVISTPVFGGEALRVCMQAALEHAQHRLSLEAGGWLELRGLAALATHGIAPNGGTTRQWADAAIIAAARRIHDTHPQLCELSGAHLLTVTLDDLTAALPGH